MNRVLNIKLLIFSSLLLYLGCSKSPSPTILKLTITDSLGNPVNGTTVSLFDNGLDYLNLTKKIGSSQITGADGIVYFSNLKSQGYFWFASKGCANDYYGKAGTFDPLKANETNSFAVEISAVGIISIVNATTNSYGITCTNVDPSAEVQGFTTGIGGEASVSSGFLPLQTFSIRIVQASTAVPNPYDKTFTVTVACDTTTITIR